MTPELRLAQMLSSNDEKQKTANAVEDLSVKEGMPKEDLDEETLQRVTATAKAMRTEARKESSAEEKISMADKWGRELAKEAGAFNDADKASKFVGRVGRLWEKHGPKVKSVAGKAGKAATDGVKAVGERIGKIDNPITRGAAAGATIGGVAGGIGGLISPERDPYTGEKKRLKTMLTKGTAGALTGAATGALTGSMQKSSSVVRLELAMDQMTKRAGLAGISAAAKNFVSQAKPIAAKAMAAATPHVQAAGKVLRGSTMGQAAGIGAAAGGTLGAAKGLVAPGKDAQGNTKSRLGGALKGAVGGAAGGAALGAGAKALSSRMPAVASAPMKLIGSGSTVR